MRSLSIAHDGVGAVAEKGEVKQDFHYLPQSPPPNPSLLFLGGLKEKPQTWALFRCNKGAAPEPPIPIHCRLRTGPASLSLCLAPGHPGVAEDA